jgi:hypothetical protein
MKKWLQRGWVWLLVLGPIACAVPAAAAEPLQRAVQAREPNRQPPVVTPPPQTPVFSQWPTDAEFLRARVFAEPLVPIGATTAEENAALARALMAHLNGGGGERVDDLTAFLES